EMDNLIIPPAPPVVEPVEPIDPGPWYYAQLNGDGRCVCVSQASAALPEADHLVRLESYDETVLGQTWVDGEWVSPPP
ncbi:hypothetical protein, partial [Klebsiella pneumoniae]|uniref:hypothetical protein n=1 Tax=Klebsiella pneumoniae TaxID=573 RepID=UPI004044844E